MSDSQVDDLTRMLRERKARYFVGAQGEPVAVLLTLEEYQHYLDLLDDEADSEDPQLKARLQQAADPTSGERERFEEYLSRWGVNVAEL
jgi:hypothetical protein